MDIGSRLFCVYDEPGTDLCLHKNLYLPMKRLVLQKREVYNQFKEGGRNRLRNGDYHGEERQ